MSDWSRDSEDLFSQARSDCAELDEPTVRDRSRVRSKLAIQIGGAAAGVITTTITSGATASTAPSASLGLKTIALVKTLAFGTAAKSAVTLVAIGGAIGLGSAAIGTIETNETRGGGATEMRAVASPPTGGSIAASQRASARAAQNEPSEPREPNEPHVDEVRAAPRVDLRAEPRVDEADRAKRALLRAPNEARAPRVAVAPRANLRDEVDALRAAHDALLRDDPREALRQIESHQSRFPTGALAEERDGARAIALCASQSGASVDSSASSASAAATVANAFLSAHPQSPLAAQVRRACAAVLAPSKK